MAFYTKKEVWQNRMNRSRSLSIQFPDKETLKNGKSRFYKKNGELVQRKENV